MLFLLLFLFTSFLQKRLRLTFQAYNCRCNVNFYLTSNNGGAHITCAPCPSGQIQSLDGFTCVYCDATCQNCPPGTYRTDTDINGAYLFNMTSTCVNCSATNAIVSGGRSCQSCKPLIYASNASTLLSAATCSAYSPLGGILTDYPTAAASMPNDFNVYYDSSTSVSSCYLVDYLASIYVECSDSTRRNATACQALANLCVLNLYTSWQAASSSSSTKVDACQAFFALQNSQSSSSSSSSNNQQASGNSAAQQQVLYGSDMPWLAYLDSLSNYYSAYLSGGGIGDSAYPYITLEFDNRCAPSKLSLLAAQYSLSGSLLSYDTLDMAKLQLCNYLTSSLAEAAALSPFAGVNYAQSCSVSVSALLAFAQPTTVFYDLFIKYGNASAYPLPVVVTNYQDTKGNRPNDATFPGYGFVSRRLFLVDATGGIPKSASSSNGGQHHLIHIYMLYTFIYMRILTGNTSAILFQQSVEKAIFSIIY